MGILCERESGIINVNRVGGSQSGVIVSECGLVGSVSDRNAFHFIFFIS